MKSFYVNLDFDHVLSGGSPNQKMNQLFEYLYFFIETLPLSTSKKYSPLYLDYIRKITGRIPIITSDPNPFPWWGDLKNGELNSKEFSTKINLKYAFIDKLFFLKDENQLRNINLSFPLILKSPQGMSGKGIVKIRNEAEWESYRRKIKYPVILEPFHERICDFSTLAMPHKIISYQNLIDDKFQYKGSIFLKKNLNFLSDQMKHQYFDQIELILNDLPRDEIFSIDSYLYQENHQSRVRALCEINYRKTMGYVGFQLHQQYGFSDGASAFLISKTPQRGELYQNESDRKVFQLSPGDTLFETYFLSAPDDEKLKLLIDEFSYLLPDSKFSVLI